MSSYITEITSCSSFTTPTPTPTLTPTCDCVEYVNVEVTSAGIITYLDCNGGAQFQNVGIGPEVIGVATCIDKNTLGGTAVFTIDSYGPCCTVVTPTPTPTPTSTPTGTPASVTPTPTPTPTGGKSLMIYARDVATSRATITMFYNINSGSNINIPGATGTQIPADCTFIYTITGLANGDVVTVGTSIDCVITGADGVIVTCPSSISSNIDYIYAIDAPSVQRINLTVDTNNIP